MDLTDSMKAVLKGPQSGHISGGNNSNNLGGNSGHNLQGDAPPQHNPGAGYVTEKLYMLLQLYLQNKGWNPSVELLQCFSELKDSALLPSAAYLQVLANRLALDSQGRLVLRESGKIVLPFEHFANAVMLKHMSGPHGLHLNLDATIRAVMESYTIGRENFGMEKDFMIEVVQSCPSPACRYYKALGVGTPAYMENFQPPPQMNADYMSHMPSMNSAGVDLSSMETNSVKSNSSSQNQLKHAKTSQQTQQQQITAAIIQQQNRAIAQQSLEKFGNLSPLEKQRVLQQLDKKHYEVAAQQVGNLGASANVPMLPHERESTRNLKKRNIIAADNKFVGNMQNQQANVVSAVGPINNNNLANSSPVALNNPVQVVSHISPSNGPGPVPMESPHKVNEFLRGNLDCLDSIASNKDLLALHNGAWSTQESRDGLALGQDKIVRAFTELMRNMARMKTFIRPSMCKPYGKQSESLQKTLIDTIQLVQSLRSCLPAPHIPVSSWKSEDRHRKDPENGNIDY